MRGETMKDKSKKSTYSTTFGVDPIYYTSNTYFGKWIKEEEIKKNQFLKIRQLSKLTISSPTFVAKWRLQFSCTSGVLGLLLNPNNQLVTSRGAVL